MKVMVTGAAGQLGHDVVLELNKRGHWALGTDIHTPPGPENVIPLDITDPAAVERTVEELAPEAIIHCAAWTDVDGAEDPDNRPDVYRINVDGTENIAKAAGKMGAKLVYISTDYVFDGGGEMPRRPEDEDFAPLNYYGETKLRGEKAVEEAVEKHFILRISWLFGSNGRNFVEAMIGAGKKHHSVRVVCDQIGTPTYSADLARLLVDMAESDRYGCYHVSNEGGYISWYDFACEIYRQLGMGTEVIPVTTEEYASSIAARPRNSRLDKSKLRQMGFDPLPAWQDALGRYLEEKGYR